MVERIRQVKYAGIDQIPPDMQKRIRAGDKDQQVHDVRPEITIAGAIVPERILEIELFDDNKGLAGECTVYAAIQRGPRAITQIVSASGTTPESARWTLGNDHNIPTLRDAYVDHRFVDAQSRQFKETSFECD